MIPNIPLLRRAPLRSGLTKSTYDPRLLIMKVDSGEFDSQKAFEHAIEFNASLVHEWAHWFQHQATSSGVFLNAVRLSQQSTTMRWLRGLPKSKLRTLLDRRDKSQVPILAIDPTRQYPIFEHGDDELMNTFRQIWYDHQWVHATFEGDAAFSPPGHPPSRVFGEIFCDVILEFCNKSRLSASTIGDIRSNIGEVRKWFAFPGEAQYLAYAGVPITTRLIMETAATIAEMELLPGTFWEQVVGNGASSYWDHRIKRLFEGNYGAPFKAFLKETGTALEDVAKILPTLDVICFAALNPALPPFVMHPPTHEKQSYEWEDVYPPIRFMRLCAAVRHVGFVRRWTPADQLAQYLGEICDAAGLNSPLELAFPALASGVETVDFGDPKADLSDDALNKMRVTGHDYSFWVQAKLAQERAMHLPLFVCLGQCLSGDYAKQYASVLISTGEGLNRVPFLDCPLHWTENETIGFRCRVDFGNWLIRSVVMHESFFETVVGTGEYDFSNLPPHVGNDQQFRETIKNSVEHNLLNVND